MHRRHLLRALPITAASAAIIPAFARPMPTPSDRLDAAIAELKAATEALYSNVGRWVVVRSEDVDSSCPLTIFTVSPPPAPVGFTGPGVYEFALLDRLTSWGMPAHPVAFLDRASAPKRAGAVGEWFRWQHIHNGKVHGRGHYVSASRVRIVRKVEALGEQA